MHVLIIDQNNFSTKGLNLILRESFDNVQTVCESNPDEIIEVLKKQEFDIILFDVAVPFIDSFSLLKSIKECQTDAKTLIFSNPEYKNYTMDYVLLGAYGFLDKNCSIDDLILAFNLLMKNKLYLSHDAISTRYHIKSNLSSNHIDNALTILSKREFDVFKLLMRGYRISEITKEIKLHQSTVSTLKRRIFKKFDVDNIISLRDKAVNYGFISEK